MSGDGTQFEYPDEAGYPDGTGTLHEGTDEASGEGEAAESDTAEDELDEFAMQDEEDVDEDV